MAKDKATTDEVVDAAVPAEEPKDALPAVSASVTEADMVMIRHSTKAALDKEPKASVRLPKADPKSPNFETVCINGYVYQIMRGVEVMVPAPVKQLLIDAGLI